MTESAGPHLSAVPATLRAVLPEHESYEQPGATLQKWPRPHGKHAFLIYDLQ